MKKYYTKEVITPVVTLLFLIIYISEAAKLSAPLVDGTPQESFFPIIIFAIGFIASLSLLISAIKKANAADAANAVKKERVPVNRKPFYIVLATAFMIFFFHILGFTIVAPIYIFMLMMIYDDKPQAIVKKVIISLLITAFVFVLYTYVFEINFPEIWR